MKTLDQLALSIFGRTTKHAKAMHICINCGKPPTFKTEAGRREYEISGMCEPCFDSIFDDKADIWKDD